MARMPRGGWRQRFDVSGGPASGGAGSSSEAYDQILEAERRALKDFQDGLITADEAMAEYTAAVRKYGREAAVTIDARQASADRVEQVLDRQAEFMGRAGVTKEDLTKYLDNLPVAELSERAKAEREMYEQLDEALDKFRKGLITAEEAARRQAAAVDRFGEKAGMTVGERWQEQRSRFGELSDAARAGGQPPPVDPKNPLGGQLANAFERFGLPGDVGKQLGGVLNQFGAAGLNLNGGLIGNLIGRGGLLSALGGMGGPPPGAPPGIGAGFSGMAGGAGGAAAGLASFAGPLAIATVGAKVMEGFYDGVSDATRRVGEFGTKVAGNDGIGAVTTVMDGFGAAAGKVPVVGGMLEAQIGMYTTFLKTFDQVTAAFASRGEELKRYDGRIAFASAMSDTNKLLADIREGQQLGNQYAELISARTQLQVEFQEALAPIKAAMMEVLIPNLRALAVIVGEVGRQMRQAAEARDKVKGLEEDALRAMAKLPLVKESLDFIAELVQKIPGVGKVKREEGDIIAGLLDIGRRGLDADAGVRQPEAVDNAPLNINLFDMIR